MLKHTTPKTATLTPQRRNLSPQRTWTLTPMSKLAQHAIAIAHATLSMRTVNQLVANHAPDFEECEIYGDDGLPVAWPIEPRDEDAPVEFEPAPSYRRVSRVNASRANVSCASRATI